MDTPNKDSGFTLVELLIGMVVAMMVLAAIFASHRAQVKSNLTQQMILEMHQNARAALFSMERDIKSAGYDPMGMGMAAIQIAAGDSFMFALDRNGDGDFTTGNPPPDHLDPNEMVAYSLTPQGHLGRSIWGGTFQIVAENIEVLNFVYLDDDGNPLSPVPLGIADRALVRSVQITIVAKSGQNVPVLMTKHTDNRTYTNQQGDILLANPNDNFRRIVLTENVKCRNLGL